MIGIVLPVVEEPDHDEPFSAAEPKRGGWALVEVMGHRSHHGFVSEVQVFGVTMCEVLVPFADKTGVQSRHLYGGSALFSLSPCSKAKCLEYVPGALRPWERQLTAGVDDDDEDPAYEDDAIDGEAPEGGATP